MSLNADLEYNTRFKLAFSTWQAGKQMSRKSVDTLASNKTVASKFAVFTQARLRLLQGLVSERPLSFLK